MANDKVELRGLYASDLMEALDMIALSRRITRADLVGRVLQSYVAQKQHEASLVVKAPQINPPATDSAWSDLA